MPTLITTSRKAGEKETRKAEELSRAITDSRHVRRGKKTVENLVKKAREKGLEKIFFLSKKNIREAKVTEDNWKWTRKIPLDPEDSIEELYDKIEGEAD